MCTLRPVLPDSSVRPFRRPKHPSEYPALLPSPLQESSRIEKQDNPSIRIFGERSLSPCHGETCWEEEFSTVVSRRKK